jgi:hypothetical protein
MRAVIQHVTGSVSMSAMAADPKHRQHLCCLVDWQQGSAKKKGLCMDCAGLVLLCYCLAQMLATDLPALRAVSMVVRSTAGPCHAAGRLLHTAGAAGAADQNTMCAQTLGSSSRSLQLWP